MPLSGLQLRCAACVSRQWPLDHVLAALTYNYPWIKPIQQFKFQEHTGWASSFAALMQSNPQIAACLSAAHWVVPMPLSDARLRTRGFNQALLLARALCHAKVATNLLARPRDTTAQSTLTRKQRWRNVRGAYQVPETSTVAHSQRIVLIDDVMTTGASLCAAASALRQAGATQVSAVVLARAE